MIVDPTPCPRYLHQDDRAPAGLKRYKVRGEFVAASRYVLAANEQQARAFYAQTHGVLAETLTMTQQPD